MERLLAGAESPPEVPPGVAEVEAEEEEGREEAALVDRGVEETCRGGGEAAAVSFPPAVEGVGGEVAETGGLLRGEERRLILILSGFQDAQV